MKRKITFLIPALIVLFLVSTNKSIFSYPRFAAYSGDKCMDCHVNPNGGTMRNAFGTDFAKKVLNMEMFKKIAGKTQFSPKITKAISVGGDVRVAQVDDQVDSVTTFNSFLAMQGDAYVNAQLNKIVNVFVTAGIQIPGVEAVYEVYGMISKLPANLYFKVGQFKPTYGIRIVEHRAYQRLNLLNTPFDANTGFELGVSPDWFNASVGLFNPQKLDLLGIYPRNFDPHKMFVGSTDFNFAFKKYDFNVNFGGSFFNNPYNTSDTGFTTIITAVKQAYGASTRIGFLRRIALLGEVDFEEQWSDIPLTRSLYGFGELNVIVIKGLELRGQYEIYNPNRDVAEDNIERYSVGFAAFPFFGFETEVMVRFVSENPSIVNDEFQWNFHFYF